MSHQPGSELKREQEKWRKIKRKKERAGATSSKVKYNRDIIATDVTSSMAKVVRKTLTIDISRACFNKESRENECSHGMSESADRVCTIQHILLWH